MSKDENEDTEIESFELSDDISVEILATGSDLVKLIAIGESIVNILVFYPDEAERVGHALLKAAERVKALASLTP